MLSLTKLLKLTKFFVQFPNQISMTLLISRNTVTSFPWHSLSDELSDFPMH